MDVWMKNKMMYRRTAVWKEMTQWAQSSKSVVRDVTLRLQCWYVQESSSLHPQQRGVVQRDQPSEQLLQETPQPQYCLGGVFNLPRPGTYVWQSFFYLSEYKTHTL